MPEVSNLGRLGTALAEVRAAPLPFVLLSFTYGAYFLASLIAAFAEGGISESEEWRIFIFGWAIIPPLAVGATLLIAGLKRARYSAIEPFYPLLLAANALTWAIFFALCLPPPWIFDYKIGPLTLHPLIALLPPVNLAVLLILKHPRFPQHLDASAAYAVLPLGALCLGVNFSGWQGGRSESLVVRWPQFEPSVGGPMTREFRVKSGAIFLDYQSSAFEVIVQSKVTGALRVTLPWSPAEGSRMTAWHATEATWSESGDLLAVFESDQVRTEIRAREALLLRAKSYQPGEAAELEHAIGIFARRPHAPNPQAWYLYAALILALAPLLLSQRVAAPTWRPPPLAVDFAALLAAFLLVFDAAYRYDTHHYNFFLGPVNDLLHGRTPLVDINCQYGVGVLYALALLFKLLPLNYPGFALLLNALLVVQYALAYLLMCRLFAARGPAVAALLLAIAAGATSQTWAAVLPSPGPLRFGLAYALLGLYALAPRPGLKALRCAVVGLASLWSLETFTYTLAAYLGAEGYALLLDRRDLGRKLLSTLGGAAFAGAATHLLLALGTYLRAGAWPDWSLYFDYVVLYSVSEFGTLTVEAWRPWALFVAVYFLSALLLLVRARAATPAAATDVLVAGLTCMAIAQFTYFLGRSHHNNLYHISLPVVVLATYWFLPLWRGDHRLPRAFARPAAYCFFTAACLLFAKAGPEFAAQWPRTPLGAHWADVPSPWSAGPSHDEVRDALALIERHAADSPRVALFLHPERTTETLMLSRKIHVFPISNPMQDDLLPSAHDRALQYDHGLQEGDYLIVTRETQSLLGLQRQVLSRLLEQLPALYADSTEHVYALRLRKPRPTSSPEKGQP